MSHASSAVVATPTPNDKLKLKLNIKHFHQLHNWDCGLACSFMFCRSVLFSFGRGRGEARVGSAVLSARSMSE